LIIVIMGVSGSGKSTLGHALAQRLGWDFIEGDDHHPADNVARMAAGQPLTDAHRQPWLRRLNAVIAGHDAQGPGAVLACSALKQSHRRRLAEGISRIRFAYLCGDPEVIRGRLASRSGHFMPAELLDSQVAALEPPEDAVLVPIHLATAQQIELTLDTLGLAP